MPEDVQALFDGLFDLSLDAALQMLTKHKEFFPFGFESHGDEAVMIAGDPGLGDHPESQAVLDMLYRGTRSHRDDVDAVAFTCDVHLQSGSDAVRVDLEHRDGHALQIVTPYRLKRFGRGAEAGQMSVSVGDRRIWV